MHCIVVTASWARACNTAQKVTAQLRHAKASKSFQQFQTLLTDLALANTAEPAKHQDTYSLDEKLYEHAAA